MGKAVEILSNLKVRNLGPGLHRDGGGLVLVVDAGGSRNWGFVYREPYTKDKFGNGKRTKLGLGGYPTVSLQQARAKAAEARGYLNETPPRSPKEVWKERRKASNTPTFSEMSDVYLATMTNGWRSDRHREQVRSNLLKHCAPIADMPVNEITTENVLLTIHTYAEQAPVAALKLRGTIEQVLAMARAKGHIDRNTLNPASWRGHLDKLLPKAPKPTHHPAMHYNELPGFMQRLREARLDSEGRINIVAHALVFLIHCGSRSGEVRLAKWSEFDLDGRLWSIPAERMKGGKAHKVPLSAGAIEIIEAMRAVRSSDFVFPGTKPVRELTAKSFERLLARLGAKCVCHGMRSTFRNWAGNRTDTPREICELALAHTVGNSVERSYWNEHPEEKHRELLEKWDRYLHAPVGAPMA